MEFNVKIAIADTTVPSSKLPVIHELSKELNEFFTNKEFGKDVTKVEVGFIVTMARPGYEEWHKEKKPRYIEYKKTKSKLTGEIIETQKTLTYEIKLMGEALYYFTGSDDQRTKKELINQLIESLDRIRDTSKKTDFEFEKFRSTLIDFNLRR